MGRIQWEPVGVSWSKPYLRIGPLWSHKRLIDISIYLLIYTSLRDPYSSGLLGTQECQIGTPIESDTAIKE